LRKRRIELIDVRAFCDLGQCDKCAYAQTFGSFSYAFQVIQPADADDAFYAKNIIPHTSQEIGPSRLNSSTISGQVRQGIPDGFRTYISEFRDHGLNPPFCARPERRKAAWAR
jgi:hypothetical protein